MSRAPVASEARRSSRLDWDRLPPWKTASALAIGLLGSLFVVEAAAGRLGTLSPELAERVPREIAIAGILSLLVAYLVGALLSLHATTRRNVEALAPSLRVEALALRDLARRAATPGPISRRVAPLLSVLLVIALASLVNPDGFRTWLDPEYWILESYWAWTGMVLFGWGIGRLTMLAIHASLTFRTLSARVESIDLLDTSPLAPFVGQGMHAALLWLGLMAILGLNLVNEDFGAPIAVGLAIAVAVSMVSLLLPLMGIRLRIRARKAEELAAVRAEVRRARATLDTDAVVRLPGLLAYEQRILGVREWLIDAPTLVRFGLYLAIPLGSWVGGAFVERLVAAALD